LGRAHSKVLSVIFARHSVCFFRVTPAPAWCRAISPED
jgi:hypothetical protein